MRQERVEVGDIPARLYVPDGAEGLLLLGHGGGYSKDGTRFVRLSRRYAEATGLAVVCIDAVAHGERAVADAPAALPRQWHSSHSPQMVRDWQATAQSLKRIGPPVAYVGFSMGALFGFSIVAAMPAITTAVLIVAGYPDADRIDDEPLHRLLTKDASQLQHASVLMANTTNDHIFPVAGVHELFDAIQSDGKQLSFWEGGHNDWSEAMIAASESFINDRR